MLEADDIKSFTGGLSPGPQVLEVFDYSTWVRSYH